MPPVQAIICVDEKEFSEFNTFIIRALVERDGGNMSEWSPGITHPDTSARAIPVADRVNSLLTPEMSARVEILSADWFVDLEEDAQARWDTRRAAAQSKLFQVGVFRAFKQLMGDNAPPEVKQYVDIENATEPDSISL